jgi:hypothetical protein
MGTWRDINAAWYKLQLVYCDLCGQIIPRRLWVAEVDGADRTFCSPSCEHLYRTYYLPEGAGATVHRGDAETRRRHGEERE